jgi:hypothetical protein
MNVVSALLALFPLTVSLARAQDPTWALLTQNDLRAIHDLLRDNHPGPVDPENARYREWLEAGLTQALDRAAAARSYGDYERALRFYTNGFQDGHLGIGLEISPEEVEWPGFAVGSTPDGGAEVNRAEEDSGMRVGDRVTECDGRTIDELLKDRVDPYFWNRAIPHDRGRHVHRLFQVYRRDPIGRLSSCRSSSGEVTLKWRRTTREELARVLESASRDPSRGPRLYRVDGVWFVSIPTLAYSNDVAVARVRAFLDELAAKASELRESRMILDVRGNRGGNSAWGKEIARAIWGDPWVERVDGSFDRTVDWRASDANIEHMRRMIEREKQAGLMESAAYWTRALEAMERARIRGQPLARFEDRPKETAEPPPSNPVRGQVFFLTDNECASACLDFADLVRRMPGVVQIGLPTSADAIYIDNTYAPLPSGLSGLGYSLKVYRNRVRGNNEWYEPRLRWPGGSMTDETLAKWVSSIAPAE